MVSTKILSSTIQPFSNISPYYCYYCICDFKNAALVRMKNKKKSFINFSLNL